MCPDKQLISVFMDGELPQPWEEKMEKHLAGCPSCSGRLENYRSLVLPVKEGAQEEQALMEAARERVWQKMSFPIASGRQAARRQAVFSPLAGGILRRRLSVPLPAAAAAMLIVVLAAFWTGDRYGVAAAQQPVMAEAQEPAAGGMVLVSEEALPSVIPAAGIEDVMQYIGLANSGDILVVRLPENRSFINSGEPVIVHAVGHDRR